MLKLRVTAYDAELNQVYSRCDERPASLFRIFEERGGLELYEYTELEGLVYCAWFEEGEINGSKVSRQELRKFRTLKDFATAFNIKAI